jgi:hypothetical protein
VSEKQKARKYSDLEFNITSSGFIRFISTQMQAQQLFTLFQKSGDAVGLFAFALTDHCYEVGQIHKSARGW